MYLLDLTLPEPAANLACDEALLDWCEAAPDRQVLRFWESPDPFVVLGYGNRLDQEVHSSRCEERRIPVLRRCSGGGTVLQGPGSLNYAVILDSETDPELASICRTNRYVMERNQAALEACLGQPVRIEGHTDLVVGDQKFSGNAQRRRRRCLLFHGTILHQLDTRLMAELLPSPSRQPDYRQERSHDRFLTAVTIPADRIREALTSAWKAKVPLPEWPEDLTRRLVREKYSQDTWNRKW